jgi:hypothetical protein
MRISDVNKVTSDIGITSALTFMTKGSNLILTMVAEGTLLIAVDRVIVWHLCMVSMIL